MPLYIRDDAVDDLAAKVMKLTGAKTKTEAVRKALLAQIAAEQSKLPLIARIGPILDRADAIGEPDPDFDMKRFTDEMWEDA
jgi:antitoxin VapB